MPYGGPRLYRFYSYEQVAYVPAPTGGWNPDANPWELPDNEAPVLDNFLIRPGKIVPRGAFATVVDYATNITPPLSVAGITNPGQVLIARRAVSTSGAVVEPWNAPLLGTAANRLAAGLTGMLYANAQNIITPVTAANADQIIGPRWINFDGLLYGISYDTAGAAVQDAGASYFMKPLSLLTLSSSLQATQAGPSGNGAVPLDTSFVGSTNAWAFNNGGIGPHGGYNWSAYGPGGVTDYLVASDYHFNIPTGATITGIEVTVSRNCTLGYIVDNRVRLVKAGAVQAADKADTTTQWSKSSTTKHYGGSSDMWSTTWTPADINNVGFGVAFAAGYSGPGAIDGPDVYGINITVYYTVTISTPTPLPTVLANAPHGAFDLKGHQSRIWLLGGIDTPGAGTTHKSTALFFSNPIGAGGGTASADWKDPVSGLTNLLVMDNNTKDFGVALALVRGGLLILRRASIWLLRGTANTNYAIVPVSRETGCLDARSVVETDHGVYFMSAKGLMLTDGVRVTNVSGNCESTLQRALALQQQQLVTNGGYISCGRTSQGQILVSIGSYNGAGNIVPIWCALFDPSIGKGGWVRLTSQLFAGDGVQANAANNYPGLTFTSQGFQQLYVIGDRYLTQLEDQTQNQSFLLNQQLYDRLLSNQFAQAFTPVAHTNQNQPLTAPWLNRFDGTKVYLEASVAPGVSKSDLSYLTGFAAPGFTVPATATILGIQVDMPRSANGATNGDVITDSTVQLLKAGVQVGQDKSDRFTPWPSSYTTKTYGGPSDLWGTTWTFSDINNANFGLALQVKHPGGAGQQAVASIFLDDNLVTFGLTITVYYSTPTSGFQYVSIPAKWVTRDIPILATSTRRLAIAKRYFFDYVFSGNGVVPSVGWAVNPIDSSGNPIGNIQLQSVVKQPGLISGSISGGDTPATPFIQRQNADFTYEISELGFVIAWSDAVRTTQPTNVAAEVYGLGVEFQRTRDAR